MKQYGLLLIAVVVLGACQVKQRQREDQTQSDPALATTELVDIAIVSPEVTTPDGRLLSATIRAMARKILINRKHYAVPKDAFVDRAAAASNATDAGTIARAAGSDAGLFISLEQWETSDLLPKGRIYAGGTARLVESGGTRVLWERSFKDWTRVASGDVTTSNRPEVMKNMLREVVQEVLSNLPPKPRR
ncbi:MAG: hypothetical protein HRU14_16005 [Planctomycetes bacterium]|nr:hypothetical protein [Planctomycetota bacterium]